MTVPATIPGTVSLMAALLLSAPAVAAAQDERYAPLVLKIPPSARALALGGAQVALRDVDAVFGNPALVGTTSALAVGAERYESGATSGYLASSSSIGMLGIGVGVHLLDTRSAFGNFPMQSDVLTREAAIGHSAVAATVAASLAWKGMRWGAAAKYVEDRPGDARAGGLAWDVGASKDLTFANAVASVALQNLGPRLELGSSSEGLPTQLAVGVSAGRGIGKWIDLGAITEVDVRRDGQVYPRAGVEVTYVPIEGVAFIGRVGGRRPQLVAERPVTLGGGFSLDRVTLDYAWEALRGGSGHRLTLRVR